MSPPFCMLTLTGARTWLLVGKKTGKKSHLVRAKSLTVNIKERGRERYLDKTKLVLEDPEHIIGMALSLHTQGTLEKWGGR